MVLHVISDPGIGGRVDRCKKELGRQNIDYKFWPSVHIANKPKRTGISKAHKQIVEWAANEGLPEVTIAEDDIWFPAEDGWEYYQRNKPEKPFDLYLGGVTRGDIDENGMTTRYTGQYLYTVSERFYDTFLGVDERLDIDGAMAGLGEFKVCYPFAAFCFPCFSGNCMGVMDYSHLLMGKEIYGFGKMNDMNDAARFSALATASTAP